MSKRVIAALKFGVFIFIVFWLGVGFVLGYAYGTMDFIDIRNWDVGGKLMHAATALFAGIGRFMGQF